MLILNDVNIDFKRRQHVICEKNIVELVPSACNRHMHMFAYVNYQSIYWDVQTSRIEHSTDCTLVTCKDELCPVCRLERLRHPCPTGRKMWAFERNKKICALCTQVRHLQPRQLPRMEQRWQALSKDLLGQSGWGCRSEMVRADVEVICSQKTIILQVRRPVELPSRPYPTFLEVLGYFIAGCWQPHRCFLI